MIYLNKLSAIARQATLEPQKRDNISDSITLFNNCRHRYTRITWLLTCITIMHQKLPPEFQGEMQTNLSTEHNKT
jgi:hypothetical protein